MHELAARVSGDRAAWCKPPRRLATTDKARCDKCLEARGYCMVRLASAEADCQLLAREES